MKIVKDWKLVYNEESKYEYYKEIKWKNSKINGILNLENNYETTKEKLSKTFDKIMKNNFLTKEAFKKMIGYELMGN